MRTVPYGLSGLNGTGDQESTLIRPHGVDLSGSPASGYNIPTRQAREMLSPTFTSISATESSSTSLSLLGVALLRISWLIFTLLFSIISIGFLLSVSVAFAILGLIMCPIWLPLVIFLRRSCLRRGASMNGIYDFEGEQ